LKSDKAGNRGYIYYRRRRILSKLWQSCLHTIERPIDVDVHSTLPGFNLHFVDFASCGSTSIVHQARELTKTLNRTFHSPPPRFKVSHIKRQISCDCRTNFRVDPIYHLATEVVLQISHN